jgi:hypothetical protein
LALTYDTKLRIPATALTTTTSAASASYTCGATAGVLVVMVMYAGVTQRTGGAPTYNSVALTQAESLAGVTEAACELWYMLSPPKSQSLTVNVPNGNGVTMWVYVASATTAAGYTCALDNTGINETTAASPSVTVTNVATPTIIFAVVATGDNTFAPTARTGNSLYEEDIAAYGSAAQYYNRTGTGNQTLSWTDTTSDDYGAIGVAFNEVTGSVMVSLLSAAETITGQTITITPGAVSVAENAAAISLAGQTLTVTPGAVSVAEGAATLSMAGQTLTVDAQVTPTTIYLQPG